MKITIVLIIMLIGGVANAATGYINGDGVIGLAESIHALQVVTGTIVDSGVSGTSIYLTLTSIPQTVFSVPLDKHFLLTDIVGEADVEVSENETTKIRARVGGYFFYYNSSGLTSSIFPVSVSISSGIVFNPGTIVNVKGNDLSIANSGSTGYGYVTLSGYLY